MSHIPLEDLSAFLDGELGPDAARQVEAHVAGCAECSAELGSLRQVVQFTRAMPRATLPARASLRIPVERSERRRGWIPGLSTALAGATLVAALALGYALRDQLSGRPPTGSEVALREAAPPSAATPPVADSAAGLPAAPTAIVEPTRSLSVAEARRATMTAVMAYLMGTPMVGPPHVGGAESATATATVPATVTLTPSFTPTGTPTPIPNPAAPPPPEGPGPVARLAALATLVALGLAGWWWGRRGIAPLGRRRPAAPTEAPPAAGR